jgi:hypothetical protein
MTDTTARRLADGILAAAVLGAAYVVATRPRLRRMATGLAITALTSTLPGWLSAEIGRAWAESKPTFSTAPADTPTLGTAPAGKAI